MSGTTELQNWLRVNGQYKTYKHGELIVFQEEKSSTINLILSGKTKAVVYSFDGQETWVGEFCVGDLFGHIPILTKTPNIYEVIAETDVQVLQISEFFFNDVLMKQERLAFTVACDLAKQVNEMTNRMIEFATLSSPRRICAELLRLASLVGNDPDKLVIRPTPVFIDVALRVSSTRETVSRTVSGLVKEGVLKRDAGAIWILKPEKLRLSAR